MPDNTRPPRSLPDLDRRPTLAARALMRAVEDLAVSRGLVGCVVEYGPRAEGGYVISLGVPSQPRTAPT